MSMSSPFSRTTLASVAALTALLFSACKKDSVTSPAAPGAIAPSNSSNAQIGTVGQPLNRPVTVFVTDANGNPVPYLTPVTWTLASSSGSVSAPTDTVFVNTVTTTTDNYGYASVTWMLGTAVGTDSLTASIAGGFATTFSATAQAGAVASLAVQSGGGQTVPAGGTSAPFVIQALDQYGNPVANVSILWTDPSGGVLSSGNTVTDANGLASVELTTATGVANYTVVASVAGQATIAATFSVVSD
jgi:adhesin/invasin